MAKILLVEDNELSADMLSRRLRKMGHEVLLTDTGTRAVALAREPGLEIILMDMSLPEMDGWDATRVIKSDPATQAIPVLALSAHALPVERERALAAGCDDYDTKPVELPRLIQKIEALLGARS